jgi:hypothetical protein
MVKHSKEQIQTKFDAITKSLKGVKHKANWFQLYDISHGIENALQMIQQLERELGDTNDTERNN